eukprot:GSMAST32.ASY1.ANO1.854.1 assembled CDS
MVCENSLNILFDADSFDVIVSAQWGFEQFSTADRETLFRNIRKWLRPSGFFFFRETCIDSKEAEINPAASSAYSSILSSINLEKNKKRNCLTVVKTGALQVLDNRTSNHFGTYERFWIIKKDIENITIDVIDASENFEESKTSANSEGIEFDTKHLTPLGSPKNIGLSGDGKTNDVWENAELPRVWRDAMYTGKCKPMKELFRAEVHLVENLLQEVSNKNCDGVEKSELVEVGCGTAELLAAVSRHNKASRLVGVELSQHMLDLAVEIHPVALGTAENVQLIKGNAMKLVEELKSSKLKVGVDGIQHGRVVAVVMNTFGIFPESIRETVIDEMIQAAGVGGIVVLGCWWAEKFRCGVEEFYKKNPRLCGEILDEYCDFEGANLFVPSTKYSSHWWSESELRNLFRDYSDSLSIRIQTSGIGIFIIATKLK